MPPKWFFTGSAFKMNDTGGFTRISGAPRQAAAITALAASAEPAAANPMLRPQDSWPRSPISLVSDESDDSVAAATHKADIIDKFRNVQIMCVSLRSRMPTHKYASDCLDFIEGILNRLHFMIDALEQAEIIEEELVEGDLKAFWEDYTFAKSRYDRMTAAEEQKKTTKTTATTACWTI